MRERLRFGTKYSHMLASLAVVALAGASYTAVTLTDSGTDSSQATIDVGDVSQLLRHLATDEGAAGRPETQRPNVEAPASVAVQSEPRSDLAHATVTSSGKLVHGTDNVEARPLWLAGVPVPGTYAVRTTVIPHKVVATLRPKKANGKITTDLERDVIVDNGGPRLLFTVLVRTYDGGGRPANRSFRLVIK